MIKFILELPRDSSRYFGNILVEKILPLLNLEGNEIIENATITKNGELTEKFKYLSDYII